MKLKDFELVKLRFYSVYKNMFTFRGSHLNCDIEVFFSGYRTEVFNTSICNLSQVGWFPDDDSWDMITIYNYVTGKEVIFKDVRLADINFSSVEI